MNKILKYSDLAKSLKVNTAIISVNVQRNKLISIIKDDKNLIDIENPVNKLWIEFYCEKNNKTFDINRVFNPAKKEKKTEKNDKEIELEDNIIIKKSVNGQGIQLEKTKLEIKRLKNQDKLDQLKIQKMKGVLIPFTAASDVFMFAIESYRTTFLQGVKSISNVFAQRLGANHSQFVEIQEKLSESVKFITEEAKANIITGLENVVKEYQEVRSRGEKK